MGSSVEEILNTADQFRKFINNEEVVKNDHDDVETSNSKNILTGFEQVAEKVESIKTDFNNASHETSANILSIVDDFSQKVIETKGKIELGIL